MKKGMVKLSKETTAFKYCFADPFVEKYCRRLADIVALKANGSYYYLLQG